MLQHLREACRALGAKQIPAGAYRERLEAGVGFLVGFFALAALNLKKEI